MGYYEKYWKPVDLKNLHKRSRGGAMSVYKQTSWYNDLVNIDVEWHKKLKRYRQMDLTVDIYRALDIIAEDISSDNADDNNIFELVFPEKMSNAQMKTIKATLDKWTKVTEFDYRFFEYVRKTIKYGIKLFHKQNDGTLKSLHTDRIQGYVMDDEMTVTHYLYDENYEVKNELGEPIQKSRNQQVKHIEYTKYPVEELLVMKLTDDPMGESVLEKVYRVWKQLQLLEDAVVIYRIVRAPERRVFYIDIGSQPIHKAEEYVERVKNKIRQKQILEQDGSINTEYNPSSMQEDYFLTQSGDGRGSKIETLPGGDNLGRIEDLQWFNKKMSLGLRIPSSYLDSYSDDPNGASYNDGRVGTAYIAELRYVGYIKRIQKILAKTLFKHFKEFATKEGVELPKELEFNIAPPQSFALYKQNETFNTLLNTYSSADNIDALSKRESMKRYLNMGEDDLIDNENAKLLELGVPKEKINKLTPHERANIVYGERDLLDSIRSGGNE